MTHDLRHYANECVVFDSARIYRQREPIMFGKPIGFWLSVSGEDDWPTWCRSEEISWATLEYEYAVTLRGDAQVLTVQSIEALDEFHAQYAVQTELERRPGGSVFGHRGWPIDWRKVAVDYQGIVIAPYQWSRRFKGPQWYYGWDCASGCIWDTGAIESVRNVIHESDRQ